MNINTSHVKDFLLKVVNFTVKIVTIATMVSGLTQTVIGWLPEDVSFSITDFLQTNSDTMTLSGLISFGGGLLGYIGLNLVKTFNLKLKDSRLAHQLWENETIDAINARLAVSDKVDALTVEKVNELIAIETKKHEIEIANLQYNLISADRLSNSTLTPTKIQDDLKAWIENAPKDLEVKPINAVIEKEVIVEVEKQAVSKKGRRLV